MVEKLLILYISFYNSVNDNWRCYAICIVFRFCNNFLYVSDYHLSWDRQYKRPYLRHRIHYLPGTATSDYRGVGLYFKNICITSWNGNQKKQTDISEHTWTTRRDLYTLWKQWNGRDQENIWCALDGRDDAELEYRLEEATKLTRHITNVPLIRNDTKVVCRERF